MITINPMLYLFVPTHGMLSPIALSTRELTLSLAPTICFGPSLPGPGCCSNVVSGVSMHAVRLAGEKRVGDKNKIADITYKTFQFLF